MIIWIYWYIRNVQNLRGIAQRFSTVLTEPDFSWVILAEGCFLMLLILAGVYMIFVYWNKQSRLNELHSNFVSSVSHELKSPLASLQLYLETIKYRDVSREETRDFVEMMLSDTERLSGLIDNILESSRTEFKNVPLHFERVNIGEFLEEILARYTRLFEERRCEAKFEMEECPILNIDKRAMRMVFNNLISNALRYSPIGSPITIKIHNERKSCHIDVIDRGFGLDRKDCKKIFKKFYRVRKKETQEIAGAGIGLFISQEIVKGHNGKISVRSDGAGMGSTFRITLPLPPVEPEIPK